MMTTSIVIQRFALAAILLSAAAKSTAAAYEWTFNNGGLGATVGNGTMAYVDSGTPALVTFGTSDGTSIPHILGQPVKYMHVPVLQPTNGFQLTFADSGPNGGGAYINQYTIILDIYSPGAAGWQALFNTDPGNANDADFYIAPDGSIGIASLGYSPPGVIAQSAWYRIGFVADLAAGLVRYYVNGNLVFTRTGAPLTDGRFSVYSNQDPGPDLLLFNEGDVSGNYTHELYVNGVYFIDRALTGQEPVYVGFLRAAGIPGGPPLTISRSAGTMMLTWSAAPNMRLQRTAGLHPIDWQDVVGTLGASTYSESVLTGPGFFRLASDP